MPELNLSMTKRAGGWGEGVVRTDNQRKGVSWLENNRKEALRVESFLLNLSNSILAEQG